MKEQSQLTELVDQYQGVKQQFIEAVENAQGKVELDYLKRRLEALTSQIKRINANQVL
jgi:regulator of replication initiation timing